MRQSVRSRRCSQWRFSLTFMCVSIFISGMSVAQSGQLDDVRERGVVRCGVNPGLNGFSHADSLGEYSGFDVDFCRAVAAAVFSDAEAVEFVPLTAVGRFPALTAGRIDVLSRNTTWTLERNTDFGEFAGVTYYDGQGFMVQKGSGIRTAVELDNVKICVARGTTSETNAADFFSISDLRYRPVLFDDNSSALAAYVKGSCIALTGDRSGLAAQRAGLQAPDAHVILPEIVSKEPLGPMVGIGDREWLNIVRWTRNCLINAEEMGLSSDDIERRSSGRSPAMKKLLGVEGNTGQKLGLRATWCASVLTSVGNYKEIYERNLGPSTPIGLERGVNALWTNGGLLYAPPF